jgi:hypothetical protein
MASRTRQMLEPVVGRRFARTITRQSGWSIGGVVLIAAVIGLGIWSWPEVQRTLKMHSM